MPQISELREILRIPNSELRIPNLWKILLANSEFSAKLYFNLDPHQKVGLFNPPFFSRGDMDDKFGTVGEYDDAFAGAKGYGAC